MTIKIENSVAKQIKFIGLELEYYFSLVATYILLNPFIGFRLVSVLIISELLFFKIISLKKRPNYLISLMVWIKQPKRLTIEKSQIQIPLFYSDMK